MKVRRKFSLRALFIAVAFVAIGAFLLREMHGYLVLEGSTADVSLSTGGAWVVASGGDSLESIRRRINLALELEARNAGTPASRVLTLSEMFVNGRRVVWYDYDRWGRRRLDLLRLRYVVDYQDRDAQACNVAIERTIERVAATTHAKTF